MRRGFYACAWLVTFAVAVYLAVVNFQLRRRISSVRASAASSQSVTNDEESQLQSVPQRRSWSDRRSVRSASPNPRRNETSPPSTQDRTNAPPVSSESHPSVETPTAPVAPSPATPAQPLAPADIPFLVTELPENATRYFALAGSRCTVDIDSNISPRTWESKIISGQIGIEDSVDFEHPAAIALYPTNLPCTASALIPVRTFKSSNPKLDQALFDSLEMQTFPNVEFQLRKLTWMNSATNSPLSFSAVGDLRIHGTIQTLSFPVRVEVLENHKLIVSGSAAIRLEDFGVTPPQAELAMGLVKLGSHVNFAFDWKMQKVFPPRESH